MRTKFAISLTMGLLLASCGKIPENIDIYNDSARDNYYESTFGDSTSNYVWNEVADFFGFAVAESSESAAIATALGTAPTLYSENIGSATPSTEYQSLLTAVGTKLVPSAITSQCGEVVGMSSDLLANTGTYNTAHYFRYKLKNADGTAEDSTRTAIVTIPKAFAAPAPLVVYGHGSQNGISYGEVSTLFSSLLASVVSISPSFPGERVCAPTVDTGSATCADSETVADAITTQTGAHIWDQDVNEFLGAYSCLVDSFTKAIDTLNPATLAVTGTGNYSTGTTIYANLKTVDVTLAAANDVPYVLFAGADRGALTAQLALARTGYYLYDASLGEASQITAYKTTIGDASTPIYPFVNGLLNIGGNYSMTMGLNQVALHSIVTDNTIFDAAPGWGLLRATLFNTYRDSLDTTEVATIAAEIASRDMVFMEQFVPVALRDWGNASDTAADAKGMSITMHPTEDKVVAFSQAQIGDGTRANIQLAVAATNATTQTIPGYYHSTFAFQPPSDWYDCSTATADAIVTACAEDADGWVWIPSDPTTDFNHVANASFLGGGLVSLTTEQESIVAGTQDSGVDVTIFNTATTCVGTATGGLLATQSKSFAAPVFNRATDEAAYTGIYSASPSTITPVDVAGSFVFYHLGCTGTN